MSSAKPRVVSAARGARAEAAAGDDSGSDGEHVLGGAADLDAAQIGGMVGAEARRADRLRERARQLAVTCRERDRRRQAARHIGGKARPGEDRRHRLGRAFGDHLAHEFPAAALDAFGAGDQRRTRGEKRRQRCCGRADGLRGNGEEERVGCRRVGEIGGQQDAVVDSHAGQKAALARCRELRSVRGIALPQRDLPSGARAGERERAAPGAGADDRDVVEGHSGGATSLQRFAAQQFRYLADEPRRLADEQALEVGHAID